MVCGTPVAAGSSNLSYDSTGPSRFRSFPINASGVHPLKGLCPKPSCSGPVYSADLFHCRDIHAVLFRSQLRSLLLARAWLLRPLVGSVEKRASGVGEVLLREPDRRLSRHKPQWLAGEQPMPSTLAMSASCRWAARRLEQSR